MSADVLPFQRRKRRQDSARHKTMCTNGHHAWVLDSQSRFDVKSGKLVTVDRCRHCQATRNRLS